jgi:hypothetical protein
MPVNKQHSQETDIHAPGWIRTRNPSKRVAADLRLSAATGIGILKVGGKLILICILKKENVRMRTEIMFLRTGTGDRKM